MVLSTLYGEIQITENFEERIPLEIAELYKISMAPLVDDSPGTFSSKVKYFNAQAAIANINNRINDWEEWVYEEHNQIINRVAEAKDIVSSKWLLNKIDFGWLRSNITPQLKTVETLYIELGTALLEYAAYYRNHYGFKGMIDSFVGALKNPVAEAKNVFGNQTHKTEDTLDSLEINLISGINQLISLLVSTTRDVFLYKTTIAVNEIMSGSTKD